NSPLFGLFSENANRYEKDNFEEPDLTPKLNAPLNTHYFSYYKPITIDHTKVAGSGSLTDFPVLISILDSDLRFDVQPDGDDIAFSYEDTWLDHEIEVFDQGYSASEAQLIAWVKIPDLSSSIDTPIRMYYGNSTMSSQQNPSGLWADYEAVYHMNQDPSSSNILDSTANNYDLTAGPGFTSGDLVDGIFGKAIDMDRTSTQYFELTSGFSNPTNTLSLEMWIRPQSLGSYQHYFTADATNRHPRIRLTTTGAGNFSVSYQTENGVDYENANSPPDWRWFYFVTNWQGGVIGDMNIYLDGSLDGWDYNDAQLKGTATPWTGFTIGADLDHGDVVNGIFEEFRISGNLHGAGWVATEYNNQYDPSSFYSVGTEHLTVWEPPNAHYFTYFKLITIDNTKVSGIGGHINFPILISLLDEDLKYHAQPDGDDIAFATDGGWLNHEIEVFNQSYNGMYAQLLAWVQIPYLSTTENTTIAIYYGNSTMGSRESPSGAWGNKYRGVWHLNELTGGTDAIKDSTSYANDGTDVNNPIFGEIGVIQNSVGFDDTSNQRIQVPDDNSLDISTELTVEAWINPNVANQWMTIVSKMDGAWGGGSTSDYDIYIATDDLGNYYIGLTNPSNQIGEWGWTIPISVGEWQHFVFTYDSSTSIGEIYVNGSYMGNYDFGIGVLGTNSRPFYIGWNRGWTGETFDGLIDEVRISSAARSSDWINTEFDNQVNPQSFYTVSEEQLVSENPPNYQYYNYFKEITIDYTQVDGTNSHLNFPLLISLLDDDLRYDVQNDGADIVFSMDGKCLDHQVELFNQTYSGSKAQLIAWVRIPFLSTAQNTTIKMYYGNSSIVSRQNPTGVWDSGYVGVWHLNEDPSGTPPQMKDNTFPTSDGSTYGSMSSSNQVNGKIGGSIDFDGNNDYISIINNPELQITGELTVQIWFKADIIQNDYLFNKMGSSSTTYGWDISFDDNTPTDGWATFRYYDGVSTKEIGYEPITNGKWYHAVGVFKPSEYAKFFLNGTLVGSLTTGVAPSLFDPPIPIVLGRRSQGVTPYYDGIIDEARISNIARSEEWIVTEYNNQFNPNAFFSVGEENFSSPAVYLEAQVNAIDLYGNSVPNILISMYQGEQLIKRNITNINGSVRFTNIIQGSYNFTATISSNIGNFTELVNSTTQPILIDQGFQIINLTCNISRTIFNVLDVDGSPLESGWIIVGNGTDALQNCSITAIGQATFWWVNTTPSFYYNYTIYYQNLIYNPPLIKLKSDDIVTPNTVIPVIVNITTINFTVLTDSVPPAPISGVKLKFRVNDTNGLSIVNLTTDIDGKATLRWLNSSGINGNYSLQIEFFGEDVNFQITDWNTGFVKDTNFTVKNNLSLEIEVQITLSDYQTEIVSLNPNDLISVKWGTQIKLRTLFNVTKAGSSPWLVKPTYADSMIFQILIGGTLVQTGSFSREEGNDGRHEAEINTQLLESDTDYIVIISAHKSGFTIPSDLIMQLNVIENEIELKQSSNNDSTLTSYWLDEVNMTLNSYGKTSERFTI
ncbi:MAG: DUF2341 domain-containing protein, partial [Promethearchaeota archaeon]